MKSTSDNAVDLREFSQETHDSPMNSATPRVRAPCAALVRAARSTKWRVAVDRALHRLGLARTLEHAGLLRRADHPDDPRAFHLELTARGTERVVQAAEAMRELHDLLLKPIGGRAGRRHAALLQTLEALLDEAEAFNRATGTKARKTERR